jgi:hypothetical protein
MWKVRGIALVMAMVLIPALGISTAMAGSATTVKKFLDPSTGYTFKPTSTHGVYVTCCIYVSGPNVNAFTATLFESRVHPNHVARMKLVSRSDVGVVDLVLLASEFIYGNSSPAVVKKWMISKPFNSVFESQTGGKIKMNSGGTTFTLTHSRGVNTLLIVVPN